MPRVLVEVDDFTASITVPEGGDARSDAAEVVADIGQRLANRTKNLQRLDGEKARLADANTFTAGPQSVDATNNEVACWESPRTSLEDSSVPTSPSNNWKLIHNFKCDGTRWYRLYTGGNEGSGMLVQTVNAHWHKSDGKWRPDTNSKDSFALFIVGEAMYQQRQPHGPTSWSTWPTGQGSFVAGVVSSETNVNAFGDVNVAGNVVVGGEITYPLGGATPGFKQRVSLIPIVSVMTASASSPLINSAGNVESAAAGGFHWWPIVLPRGAQLQKIEWIVYQFNAIASSLCDGQYRPAADYSTTTPPLPVFTTIAGGVAGPAASGFRLITNDYTSAPVVIDPNVEYRALWLPGTAGPGKDAVGQIRLTFLDPGPRNN